MTQAALPTILIVDDEPRNIQLLANLLREAGFIIEYATSGSAALQWLNTRPFDLVLLDILMPGMDGYEVCRRMKNDLAIQEIPVIFLTALTDTASVVNGFAMGAADYVMKPFHKEELLARVNAHVLLARQRAELSQYARLLEEKAAQLEIENQNKEKLFSILAHDLRNPLISILDFARLLQDTGRLSPATLDQLSVEFHVSAERMLALVDNLLAWSRIQRGLFVPHPVQFHLRQAVQARIELLAVGAQRKSIKIINKVDSQLRASADLEMVGTILDNLLSNALKFSHPGGVITIKALEKKGMLEVHVADTGIGIPHEHQTDLFDPGLNLHRTGTGGEKGTGMGLAVCKEFVEKNGGKIWVAKSNENGSCFAFTLPILVKSD